MCHEFLSLDESGDGGNDAVSADANGNKGDELNDSWISFDQFKRSFSGEFGGGGDDNEYCNGNNECNNAEAEGDAEEGRWDSGVGGDHLGCIEEGRRTHEINDTIYIYTQL
jgi:hypothetical protein